MSAWRDDLDDFDDKDTEHELFGCPSGSPTSGGPGPLSGGCDANTPGAHFSFRRSAHFCHPHPAPNVAVSVPESIRDEEEAANPLARLEATMTGLVGGAMDDLMERLRGSVKYTLYCNEMATSGSNETPCWPRNIIFSGNSGMGKTTIAHKLADALFEIGLLPGRNVEAEGGQIRRERVFVEVHYMDLPKRGLAEFFERKARAAVGGVIFFDNIDLFKYNTSLMQTLPVLIDEFQGRVVFAVAGYPDGIETFLQSNQGLVSRFTEHVRLPDLTAEELMTVVATQMTKSGYTYADDATEGRMLEMLKNHTPLNGHIVVDRIVPAVIVAYKLRMYRLWKENRRRHDEVKGMWTKEDIASAEATLEQTSYVPSSAPAGTSQTLQAHGQKRNQPDVSAPGKADGKRRAVDAASSSHAAPLAAGGATMDALMDGPSNEGRSPEPSEQPPAPPAARTAVKPDVQEAVEGLFEAGKEFTVSVFDMVKACVSDATIFAYIAPMLPPDPHHRFEDQKLIAMGKEPMNAKSGKPTIFNKHVKELIKSVFEEVTEMKGKGKMKGIRLRHVGSTSSTHAQQPPAPPDAPAAPPAPPAAPATQRSATGCQL